MERSIAANKADTIDTTVLFERIAAIIENWKNRIESRVYVERTLMYWEI